MHTTQHTEPEQKKAPLAPIPEWLTMSKEERAAWLRENGKGYLSKEEQEERPCRDRRSVESLAPPGVRPCRAHQTRPGITPAFLPLRRPFSVPYQQAHERDGQLLQAS